MQAQGRRRRLPQGAFRTEQKRQLGIGFRGQLQAPHAGETDALRPGQHGAAAAAAQRLFAGPQRILLVARAHQQQAFEPQALRLQRTGVGYPGRVHQHHPLVLAAQLRQGREQQAELAEAGIGGDDLADRAQRPAPARQARVQPRVSGGQGALPPAELAPRPQLRCGVEELGDVGFSGHIHL